MLSATTHVGSENSETTMEQYIFKRRADGINIINLKKTWEKLMLAARAIAAIENPEDIFVASSRAYGQRACLKFARYIGATAIAGRFTPGAFTNQIQATFNEPRLLVVTDPRADHQPVTESSYANIPIIAFCNVDSPTRFIDLAIPCNNKSANSIGLMWWFLTREVLRLRGSISRELQWDVMPDLFFHRNPDEAEKEEQQKQETLAQDADESEAQQAQKQDEYFQSEYTDWDKETRSGIEVAPSPAPVAVGTSKYQINKNWSSQQSLPQLSDWAAETAAPSALDSGAAQWVGSSNWN